jgi:hypothetical protein
MTKPLSWPFCCGFVAFACYKGAQMPTEDLCLIVGKAVADPAYRDLLFLDPGKALAGYALTDQEAQALQELSRERLEALAIELQARLDQAASEFLQRRHPNR